jgi:competence protein ComEC
MPPDLPRPASPAPLFAGLLAGAALQLQQPALWEAAFYEAIGAAALMGTAWAAIKMRAGLARAAALALLATALAFGVAGTRAAFFAGHALPPVLEGRDLQVTGIVAAMPQRGEVGTRFRLEVESALDGVAPVALPPQLALGWYAGSAVLPPSDADALRPGERWQMTVRLKAPHGHLNPHGFDYELFLWEQGLQATGYVRAGGRDAPPRRIGRTWLHPVEQARHAVRDAILRRVSDPKAAGILAALVVGDQAAIDKADWDVFRATGVAHLMSISGLHVTMFAWAAALAVGWLWRRSARLCLAWPAQHAALVGGVLLATAYALFSGWGVPSQRTVCMLATVAVLRLAGRRWPWPQVWLCAAAVVVMADPWALLQAGFWLSFVAVGVLFATEMRAARAAPERLAGRFASVFREQGIVTLALAPLTLLLFGQVSVVGLAANLLAIPWVTLVVTPLAMGGVFLGPLWDVAALAVQALGAVLQWMAAMPFATLSAATPPWWLAAGGVLGGLLLVMPLPVWLRAMGVPLLLPVLLWQAPRPAGGEFELLTADVGQGNAVLVRTAGHTLVYDAGPRYSPESDAGHRVLVPLLRALGERVDTLVLSHRDIDHTGGAAAVLAMQPQAALLSSIEPQHELQAIRPATRCEAGQEWEWDGVHFAVLHPGPQDYDGQPRPNAVSCTLRITNGRAAALLAGDIEQPQEAALVEGGAPLQADVLLVPHHGSKTSSSGDFLDAVKPRLALVQAGYRNRFGHPAAPVMARYADRGIRVVRSDACGAARWSSAAPDAVACERERSSHYWNHRPAAR